MARTWLGTGTSFSESKFDEAGKDASAKPQIHYDIRRNGDQILFSVAHDGSEPFTTPIKFMIGGKRHGVSLLFTVDQLAGIQLERPAMVEARYALFHTGSFVLSPGFPKEQPQDLEHELGRVLTPGFEVRCLTCHGKPGTLGAGEHGGVRCESCHGPASAHVDSLKAGGSDQRQVVKPRSLKGTSSLEICAQCHSGFKATAHADPVPEDLLVSSQVPALRHSECFIQSGAQLTCTTCHNPHEDSQNVSESSIGVCLRCHSVAVTPHAAICPVNRTQGCIGCHMPVNQVDSFRVTDHWIRVQPDVTATHRPTNPDLRSKVIPKREFLRLISVATDEDMQAVTARLAKGDSFGSVAHDLSKDPSAQAGGYIGDMALADMNPGLASAAEHLAQDSNSDVIRVGDNRVLLHRMPRDFKWQANRLFHESLNLNDQGERALALKKAKQALDIYPYQLKGLILMGILLRQAGDMRHALSFLGFAAQAYPQDAATQFDLALAQDSPNKIEQLRRVIDLDPDILAAYQTLGAALEASGDRVGAIEAYRAGLKIDPLSAALYYDLSLALKEQGNATGAANALTLATRIDSKVANPLGR